MKELNVIAKNAGIFFLGTISIKLFNYLFRVIGSRGLGTEGYGAFVLALAVFNVVATIALFGIPLGITRYVSYYMSKNKRQDAASAVKNGTMITVALSIVLSIGMYFSAGWLAGLVNHPEIAGLIRVFAIGLPFFSVLTCLEKALEGFKQMKYSVTGMNILHFVKVIAIVCFLVAGFKEEGAALSYVIGLIISASVMVFFLERKVFPVVRDGLMSFTASRTLLAYSWPLIVAEVATPIISWTDSIILGYFFSTAEVGIYNISMTTAALLLIFFTSFSTIIFPVMSEHVAKKKKKEMKEQYQIATTWILTLTLPVIIMCFLFGEQILTLFYGFEFSKGAAVFMLLTLAYLVTVIVGPMGAMVLALGRTKMSMINVTLTAIINLVLNILLIPKMGMLGAGIASMVSLIFISLLRMTEIYIITKIHPFSKRFKKPIVATLVSVAILLLCLDLTGFERVRASMVIPISIAYGLLYSWLMIRVFKLSREEAEIMNSILRKTGLARLGLRLKE